MGSVPKYVSTICTYICTDKDCARENWWLLLLHDKLSDCLLFIFIRANVSFTHLMNLHIHFPFCGLGISGVHKMYVARNVLVFRGRGEYCCAFFYWTGTLWVYSMSRDCFESLYICWRERKDVEKMNQSREKSEWMLDVNWIAKGMTEYEKRISCCWRSLLPVGFRWWTEVCSELIVKF